MTVLVLDKAEVVVCKVVPVVELDPVGDNEFCDEGDEEDEDDTEEAGVCDEGLAGVGEEEDGAVAEVEAEGVALEDELADEDNADVAAELLGCDDELAGVEEDNDVVREGAIVCDDKVADEGERLLELPGAVTPVEMPTLDDPAVDVDGDEDDNVVEEDANSEVGDPTAEDIPEEEEGLDEKELPDVP